MLKFGLLTTGILVIFLAALLVSGKRLLIYEHKVNPGETYVVEEHGNLGEAQASSLHCKYFTGRSIVQSVFWYSPNGVMGKDSCPFITSQ